MSCFFSRPKLKSKALSQIACSFAKLAVRLSVAFTETEFSPPAAQFIKDTCETLKAKKPPVFQYFIVSSLILSPQVMVSLLILRNWFSIPATSINAINIYKITNQARISPIIKSELNNQQIKSARWVKNIDRGISG